MLSKDDIDTIGEILNISMGSAATAMSALLDRQVVITPPTVSLEMLQELDYAELEPAILVKIQGISGSNVMLFRQNDMQVILNLLMGTDDPPRPDFEFDELSMSAACEVMNQMMGASATALSDVLGDVVDISTPDAYVVTSPRLEEYIEAPIDRKVVAISFGMSIADVMETSFASIMSCELAAMIIKQAQRCCACTGSGSSSSGSLCAGSGSSGCAARCTSCSPGNAAGSAAAACCYAS